MIPHSKPSITDDDAERVARVVRSGQLAQGPEVAALERELAARLGVPHAFGLAADLEPFQALAVPVIEDCAQALGAELDDGRPAGSRGALAVCSFYATKMIAAGEGGAVAGPAALIARVREARDYDERTTLAPRTNAKLTDMAAALARGQLARLDAFIARRRALAARYRAALAGAPVRLPADAGPRHVYHRFVPGPDRH